MRISISQFDVQRGEAAHNLNVIEDTAKEAAKAGADLLCLPEMATTGFDWKNQDLLDESARHHEVLSSSARKHRIAICGSFLERAPSGRPANTLLYFDRSGEVLTRYRKIHLFSVFLEDRFVERGNQVVVSDIKHTKAGFGICYDLRFPELFRANMLQGAQVQILPAAFPHPRLEHWRTLIKARAIENQCFFIAVNQVGLEGLGKSIGSAHYFGHSMIVDPWGEVLVEAGEEPELLTVDIDLSLVGETRSKLPSLNDQRPDLFQMRTSSPSQFE